MEQVRGREHALVEVIEAQMLVGAVLPVVGVGVGHHDGRELQDVGEGPEGHAASHRRQDHRGLAAVGALHHLDHPAGDRQVGGGLGRVVAPLLHHPDRAPAQVVGDRCVGRLDHREALAADVLENSPVYRLDALVLHEARVERHRCLVRDDRLRFLAGEAALEAADAQGGAEHEPLEVLGRERDPELSLDRGPVERDAAHEVALRRGGRDHAVLQTLHQRGAVGRGHRGQQAHQPPGRVGDAEVARVHVAAGGLERQLERENPARAEGHGGPAAGVLRPIGHQDEVGGQQVAVPLGEGAEVLAAHLLLAVEDELDRHPGADAPGAHQLDRGEVRPDRPLVVGGAAAVELVAGQGLVGDTA